ncbi:MAG: hypothetical protein IV100_17080 [Myxococcales bacterium]|nr:hypothetical protein [Myxococcales bacterium]
MMRERRLILFVMMATWGASCVQGKEPAPAAQSVFDSTGTAPIEDGKSADVEPTKPPLDVVSDSTSEDVPIGVDLPDDPEDADSIADFAWPSDIAVHVDTAANDTSVDIVIDITPFDTWLSNDADAKPTAEVTAIDAETPWDSEEDIGDGEVQDADVAPLSPGSPCDDDSLCTGDDVVIEDGTCAGTKLPCVDSDPCTQDHCYARVGCTHVLTPGCSAACGECPYSLGFTCNTTGEFPICENLATDEVYVPSGLFWLGTNVKAKATFDQWEANDFQWPKGMGWEELLGLAIFPELRFRSYLQGFAIDRVQFDGEKYQNYCWGNETMLCFDSFYDCTWVGKQYELCSPDENIPAGSFDGRGITGSSYCIAQGKRLCWETEWEKAAAGGCAQLGIPESDLDACAGATRVYPWGDTAQTCEVNPLDPCHGSFPRRGELEGTRSVYGTLDQGGIPEATLGVMLNTGRIAQYISAGFIEKPEDIFLYRAGMDSVMPPVGDIDQFAPYSDFAELCSYGTIRISQRSSLAFWRVHGSGWPLPELRDGSARCCRDIPVEAVTPEGGEPPWPPELARPEPCYGPWMFPVPPL